MLDADAMRNDLDRFVEAAELKATERQAWSVVSLDVATRETSDHDALHRDLETATDGWLALQSRVIVLRHGRWVAPLGEGDGKGRAPDPAGERVLGGEFVMRDGTSRAIQHLAGLVWQVTDFREGNGEAVLAREQTFESVLRVAPSYRTRTYLRPGEHGYVAFASRFLGFEEGRDG